MRRIVLIILVAIGLSPGLLWRDDPPPLDYRQLLTLTPLSLPEGDAARIGEDGPLVVGAWRLESPNWDFGSYSALSLDGDTLLAISDRGRFLRFPLPGMQGRPELGMVLPGRDDYKPLNDMEAITRDPVTGRIWLGLEGRNAIVGLAADMSNPEVVQPVQMRRWRANGGPESLLRLPDGRFIALAESRLNWGDETSPGLLFPSDPLDGGTAKEFRFAAPGGYYPVDLASLPDGRVLILLRGVKFFLPGFTARLAIADPADIRAGEVWKWQPVGEIAAPLPMDNYEGMAVTGGGDGKPVTIWIISDSNNSKALQQTLLLRMEWPVPPRAQEPK